VEILNLLKQQLQQSQMPYIVDLENTTQEIADLVRLLNKLVNTKLDGIIIQDLGLLYILKKHFPTLDIHASTQLTTHNTGQMDFLKSITASRVNLSRELNKDEIETLVVHGKQNQMLTEVFVHGYNCISFSGLCYATSATGGNSGNRGKCSQACRDKYKPTETGKEYPLNIKDNSAFFDLEVLAEMGVASLKIEGRIKKCDYVHTVVDSFRKQIDRIENKQAISTDNSALYHVFNRDFSNSFLEGSIEIDMFSESPRDHSAIKVSTDSNFESDSQITDERNKLYKNKDLIRGTVQEKIAQLSIEQSPLYITAYGSANQALKLEITTYNDSFEVLSSTPLSTTGKESLTEDLIFSKLKTINDTEHSIDSINTEQLASDLYISFKELNGIKKQILFRLNNSKDISVPIVLPKIETSNEPIKPRLSVLISNIKEVALFKNQDAEIYFQMPSSIKGKVSKYVDLFLENENLIPWFLPVIIGDDYTAATEFLELLKPKKLVSNNTGIAVVANQLGIDWIAGPFLNTVNTYSLLCLKEELNCKGAFISSELNKKQIARIKKPKDFDLYYSFYHHIILMTTRQCMFHQVTGCHKTKIDNKCISNCTKSLLSRTTMKIHFTLKKQMVIIMGYTQKLIF
jgi:putative protease